MQHKQTRTKLITVRLSPNEVEKLKTIKANHKQLGETINTSKIVRDIILHLQHLARDKRLCRGATHNGN